MDAESDTAKIVSSAFTESEVTGCCSVTTCADNAVQQKKRQQKNANGKRKAAHFIDSIGNTTVPRGITKTLSQYNLRCEL